MVLKCLNIGWFIGHSLYLRYSFSPCKLLGIKVSTQINASHSQHAIKE